RAGNDSAKAEAVQLIEESAKAQQQLIEDLLDVSRIISGKLRLNFRPTNLATLIQAAVDAVRPTADAKSIQIVASFEAELGKVEVDAGRIQQVAWNLLNNAVK